ncbi:ATP-dependent metallopeptidase FtsH/Yme1/Tma family protein, partial [Francisella tularensis]|uniref:ATP-dependent metallopeptidase FtsH/Yme1/Tma family protein n=1 Tax=Francisella tularensis TaxID=263 RepID=UPI00238193C5
LVTGNTDTNGSSKNKNYSTFISKLKDNQISDIDVDGRTITGKTKEGESFVTYAPLLDGSLVNKFEDSYAIVKSKAPEKANLFLAFFLNWLQFLLIFVFFIYMMVKACVG